MALRRATSSDTRRWMKPRVRILDDALVDQIAAGEVVERPSSVVKELLENAIDAGATNITVEVSEGGRTLIRVTDDGSGMLREDAELAITRHATSKIRSMEDLEGVMTLGFRGEALPSIASVSRFTLTTRTHDAVGGVAIDVAGGAQKKVRDAGAAAGTTVEVRDLFYNVPARRKFLKARQTESGHIMDACLRAALAHPELRLIVIRDGKRAREYLPCPGLTERARTALSEPGLEAIRAERDGVEVEALLDAPEKARSGARQLYLFVNGRPVADRQLARAVAFAYGSVLPPGRYPKGVVHITLDPRAVDVNAHPQKAEVRFARGRATLDAITRLLSARLGTQAWSKGGPAARGEDFWSERLGDKIARQADPWGLTGHLRERPAPDLSPSPARDQSGAQTTSEREPAPLLGEPGFFGSLRFLAQVRRMLLVCEGESALHILDQHAVDERIRYHGLRESYASRQVATQRLLFPERVEVSEVDAALVEENQEALSQLGLEVSLLGNTTAAVHAVPTLVKRAPPEALLRDILDEISRRGERSFGDAIDTAIATMACHGAIRAGDSLSPEECVALLRSLDAIDAFAGHCPHGRPVLHSIDLREIEHRLGR